MRWCGLAIVAFILPTIAVAENDSSVDVAATERFAKLALDCVHREFPNKISHVMSSAEDAKTPHELTPVFYGCYDWHSAVHGHWLLVRLCRTQPDAPFVLNAMAALDKSFTAENVAAELVYMRAKGRGTFERPYGLAWLLQLSAELREWDDAQAQEWAITLRPLEQEAAIRLKLWLPKLSHPVRTGEHSQTAFALGLVLDWARTSGDVEMVDLVTQRSKDFYLADRAANLAFEPDGQAFLSPIIAEADLMRRVLAPQEFAEWLQRFLPELRPNREKDWLKPAIVSDKTDGHLVHLDGLNLSRSWMLEGIVSGLPAEDVRIPVLRDAASAHRDSGIAAFSSEHYEGSHWLGSFAVYLTTRRGL
jgi:hypothetical protein